MPNWCNNSVTITGPAQKIRALWAQAEKGQGLLQAMVPPPENMFHGNLGTEEREMCAEQGIPNWYDWQVANWGTKWDVGLEGLELSEDGTEISGWFDSAWSPPVDAYSEFSDLNPDCSVEAYYEESGMCFVGYWNSQGENEEFDYSEYSSDTIRDNIPEYLVDYYALDERLAEYEEEEEMM